MYIGIQLKKIGNSLCCTVGVECFSFKDLSTQTKIEIT